MEITKESIYEQIWTELHSGKRFFNLIYLNDDDDDDYVCEIIRGEDDYAFVLDTPNVVWAYTVYTEDIAPKTIERVAGELEKAIAADKKGELQIDED